MRVRRFARPAAPVRPVVEAELREALELCRADPVGSVMVAARIEQRLAGQRPAGELWGHFDGPRLDALCWSGANLIPSPALGEAAARDFAEYALWQGRQCSALCGPREDVVAMWRHLREHWSPVREIRSNQPSLVIDGLPLREPDPELRLATVAEFEDVFDASVRMFTEEVGYSPLVAGELYRARVAEQVKAGLILVRSGPVGVDGRPHPPLVFKGEVGARALGVAQLQGLWVEPAERRRGYGARCVAGMVCRLLADGAQVVSLYVNDYNLPARAMYRALGFEQAGQYATVLF